MAERSEEGKTLSKPAANGAKGSPVVTSVSRLVGNTVAALNRARSIAVITKFRFMGDSIVATPFLTQLREQFPEAAITLFTAPSVAVALEGCPHLDNIRTLDIARMGRFQHTRRLYGWLREGSFDAAFILNRSLHSATIATLARIPIRVGYSNEFGRPFLTVPIPYFFDRNEADAHLDMLRALGLPARASLPRLWIHAEERRRAFSLLERYGWSMRNGARPLIGIQPGANDAYIREWGASRFARVADGLLAQTQGRVIIMGNERERTTASLMAVTMRQPSINLVGELDLRDALSVIGLCDLWIGNDTGLLHAAVGQRVPSVGIFGPNKVVRWGYDTARHRSLVRFPDTPARTDKDVRRCLDAITEEEVLDAALAVLQGNADADNYGAGDHEAGSVRSPYFGAHSEEALTHGPRRR